MMKQINFKIIAIKALEECDTKFTKALVKNELYYFYSDYSLKIDGKLECLKINEDSYPENLFNVKHNGIEMSINISAIVGKNGSGKSTIIELLFRAINNVACNYLYQQGNVNKTITANLKAIKGVFVDFYFQTDNFYKVSVTNSTFKVFKFDSDLKLIDKPISDFSLSNFFYTEAVNYSHYAYNSVEFAHEENGQKIDWLKELFHKNDSYQTPLVLNPMRTRGNFDINRENDLVKQRLLANLLRPNSKEFSFRNMGDNLEACQLHIDFAKPKEKVYYEVDSSKVKDKKLEKEINTGIISKIKRDEIIKLLFNKFYSINNFDSKKIDANIYELSRSYIVYKLISICYKYEDYKGLFSFEKRTFKDSIYDKIHKDSSHITFKIKQTLNYLYSIYIRKDYINYHQAKNNLIDIQKISDNVNKFKKDDQPIIELIPPPIFNIEIILKQKNSEENEIDFNGLSSGEKQVIYMVSSLLYHLYNLDSVTRNKIKYENINIVLEEVELYFHPELQKSFIKYFLDSIKRIELKSIKSINICFVTHSPFILSDIPSNNIMFLEIVDGKAIQRKNKRKTFGANIHELLTDSFFMSNGYTGDFAKDKIDKTINWLNDEILKKKELNFHGVTNEYEINQEEYKFHRGIISLIDEPILRIKLSEMLSEIDSNDDFHVEIIKEQIKYLEGKISKTQHAKTKNDNH